jgi:hypothetical protein
MGVTVTVPATVVEFDPPTTIAWRGEKWGIQAVHSYRFLPRAGGTLLCNEETFSGVWFPFSALMSPWYRASKLSSKSLHGIRRELARLTGDRATQRIRCIGQKVPVARESGDPGARFVLHHPSTGVPGSLRSLPRRP